MTRDFDELLSLPIEAEGAEIMETVAWPCNRVIVKMVKHYFF